ATGAVMAQATLYGRSDIGYGIKATQLGNGGTGVKQLGVMDGGNAGSRIGFRGTEDLGGGMKAHFVTEQGISPTNGCLVWRAHWHHRCPVRRLCRRFWQ
ncbi:MAG: porin, partial [Betaproteobacteria bacterium]|nr:porin [Betaproteobacteria bacterium]